MYHPVYQNNTTGEYIVKYYRPEEQEDSNLTLVHPYTAYETELDISEIEFQTKINSLFEEFKTTGISYSIKNNHLNEGYFTITIQMPDYKIFDKSVYIKTYGE